MADISKITVPSGTTYNVKDESARSGLNEKAPLASPAFTGTPTAPTAAEGTNTTQIATTAFVKKAVESGAVVADAMVFKGTIGSSEAGADITVLPSTHVIGWTYKVITAGTYAGKTCEIGDIIICNASGTSADNSHWSVVQGNIDGAVIGPASSTDGQVAVFNGVTGKVIKDSGFTIGKSVPSNAVFTDTHRPVKVNDTEALGNNGTALNLKAGSNVTLSVSGGDVTINATDTTYTNATTSAAGLMSASDKSKLEGIAEGATANAGTITGIMMNGQSKGTSGVVDLGTVITSQQDISGKKNTQSAVSDPTASGNSVTFIDTISQDAQGVILPTKKTVSTMGAASSSVAGTAGLVPVPAIGDQEKFLRGDGSWKGINFTVSDDSLVISFS